MSTDRQWPTFAELPVREGAPPGSSWGVFGDTDELGTLNFAGSEEMRNAAALVRQGKAFPLNWDLSLPSPALFARTNYVHNIFYADGGKTVDDYLDGFYLQGSSQWDALRHIQDIEYGGYNGASLEDATRAGGGPLGIDVIGRRGVATRGVLLDIPRTLAQTGVELDPFDFYPIDAELLEQAARTQGIAFKPGDVLLIRVGWVERYEQLDENGRHELKAQKLRCPGLFDDKLPEFLWDNRIAAVAADNPAVDVMPQPTPTDQLPLHRALIARLGMPLGEMWQLGPLAADCAADGVYECLFTSAPLTIPGGAGSPPNALALK